MLKTLASQSSDAASSAETFGDLVFCALVVLVLFVMALAIEVSQRIRSDLIPIETVAIENTEELSDLTKEEFVDLSKKLQHQQEEIKNLHGRLQQREATVSNQIAALQGEQRFTGAREPASLQIAYDYRNHRFYFHTSREIEHADRRTSGESAFAYSKRKIGELVDIALKTRKQRAYTLKEMKSLYTAFSQYREIIPDEDGYHIEQSQVGISYHVKLCEFICGDSESPDGSDNLVETAIHLVYFNCGPENPEMYPRCTITVSEEDKKLIVNGVVLSPKDLRDILLSFSGRGAMLDFDGYDGKAPKWLVEKVLIPTGYVSKIPKIPDQ